MGGYGSGATATRPGSNELPRFDLRALFRAGLLAPPAGHQAASRHAWSAGGRETARASVLHDPARLPGALAIAWEAGGGSGTDLVRLERTAAGWGGERAWGRCPGCGRRCAVLWLGRWGFRCRGCVRVAYASTREDAYFRAVRACETVRGRLVPDVAGERGGMVFERPTPPRPRGMHRVTYRRLLGELREAEGRCNREFVAALRAFVGRYG